MPDDVPPWSSCAFCGKEIEPSGYDPCSVQVWSADETRGWSFGAHATCIRDAFVADLRDQVGRGYEYPPED